MKTNLFFTIVLATLTVKAGGMPAGMAAPGWMSLNKIDSAVTALAAGGKKSGLARVNFGDVPVHSANVLGDKKGNYSVEVDIGNNVCSVKLTAHMPPKGVAGLTTYTGAVSACRKYMTVAAVEVMKYEDARKELSKLASSKMDVSFEVKASPQGPVVALIKK